MKRKWFFVGIILILLGVVLIFAWARISSGFSLNRPALALSATNARAGYHNLWGTGDQSSAGSSDLHSGLWGAGSPSTDLRVLSFSTGALTPAFAPATTAYTQTVDQSISSLTVTAQAAALASTVTLNGTPLASGHASGPLNLAYGPNTLTLVVTAQAGRMTRTYTVTVNRWYRVFLPVILR